MKNKLKYQKNIKYFLDHSDEIQIRIFKILPLKSYNLLDI